MSESLTIPAIHDDDLEKLLLKYRLLDRAKRGELNCLICGTPIPWDNVYALVFEENIPHLICDATECMETLSSQT